MSRNARDDEKRCSPQTTSAVTESVCACEQQPPSAEGASDVRFARRGFGRTWIVWRQRKDASQTLIVWSREPVKYMHGVDSPGLQAAATAKTVLLCPPMVFTHLRCRMSQYLTVASAEPENSLSPTTDRKHTSAPWSVRLATQRELCGARMSHSLMQLSCAPESASSGAEVSPIAGAAPPPSPPAAPLATTTARTNPWWPSHTAVICEVSTSHSSTVVSSAHGGNITQIGCKTGEEHEDREDSRDALYTFVQPSFVAASYTAPRWPTSVVWN